MRPVIVVALLLICSVGYAEEKKDTVKVTVKPGITKVLVAKPAAASAPAPAAAQPSPAPAPAAASGSAQAASSPAPAAAPEKVKVAPVPPLANDAVKVPQDLGEAFGSGQDLVSAARNHQWYFLIAGGIFMVVFLMGLFGIWEKVGKFWAWYTSLGLSVIAAVFVAFGTNGFSWGTFLSYVTAGPFISYMRDIVKDTILIKKDQQ
jgi:nucleoid-associated protein YgaU